MATQTTTGEPTLTLEPPAPLTPVSAHQAAGLVPLDEGQKSQLEQKADEFINELVRAHVYRDIPAAVRTALHAAIADRLLAQEAEGQSVPGL